MRTATSVRTVGPTGRRGPHSRGVHAAAVRLPWRRRPLPRVLARQRSPLRPRWVRPLTASRWELPKRSIPNRRCRVATRSSHSPRLHPWQDASAAECPGKDRCVACRTFLRSRGQGPRPIRKRTHIEMALGADLGSPRSGESFRISPFEQQQRGRADVGSCGERTHTDAGPGVEQQASRTVAALSIIDP